MFKFSTSSKSTFFRTSFPHCVLFLVNWSIWILLYFRPFSSLLKWQRKIQVSQIVKMEKDIIIIIIKDNLNKYSCLCVFPDLPLFVSIASSHKMRRKKKQCLYEMVYNSNRKIKQMVPFFALQCWHLWTSRWQRQQ